MQFIKVHYTANVKNLVKYALKKKQLIAKQEKDLLAKKRKNHDDPQKKRESLKGYLCYKTIFCNKAALHV